MLKTITDNIITWYYFIKYWGDIKKMDRTIRDKVKFGEEVKFNKKKW